jgi:hypothetical protein
VTKVRQQFNIVQVREHEIVFHFPLRASKSSKSKKVWRFFFQQKGFVIFVVVENL